MRTLRRLTVIVVLSLILPACAAEGDAPSERVPAIDFTLETIDGSKTVSLSDYAGKMPVVVNFWASWCPDCKEEMPAVHKVFKEYSDDTQVICLAVNMTGGTQETAEAAKAYLDRNRFVFNYVLMDPDNDAASKYELYTIPTTLFIDKEGFIVKRHDGTIDEKTLRAEIASLLSPQEGRE